MKARNRLKKWLRRLPIILAVLELMVVSFIMGGIYEAFSEEPYGYEHEKARHALHKTNIQQDFDPEFVIHGSQAFRDMYSQTFFFFHYDRNELMEAIRNTEGWHVETITADDYRDFVEITWYPTMIKQMISDDTSFDAWFYRERSPDKRPRPIKGKFSDMGNAARGFEFAVFDEDTGLFVFIDQFG